MPTSSEHACIVTTNQSLSPTVDVDIDTLSIVNGSITVPTGRTVDVNYMNSTMILATGSTLRSRGGTGSALAGSLYLRGTLRVEPGTNLDVLIVRNTIGETSNIDADGDISIPQHSLQGSLHLIDDTRINNGSLTVGGSISGDPGTSVRATSLTVGLLAEPATLSVPVRAATITFRGEVDVSGDVTSPTTALTLTSNASKDVDFHSSSVTAATIQMHGGRYSMKTGSRIVASSRIESFATSARLVACELDSPSISFVNPVTVEDVGCIDPPAGSTRKVTTASTMTFVGDGAFDDGGDLQLGASRMNLPANGTLTDGATNVSGIGSTIISASGPGTTRLEHLFEGTVRALAAGSGIQYVADEDEVLLLDTPTRSLSSKNMCADKVTAIGTGRVEIHDDAPIATGCVFGDDPGPGASPVTYVANGVPYEPARNFVSLNGGTWTASGTIRAVILGGHGTIQGSIDVDFLKPYTSTLKVNGAVTAESLEVPLIGAGVLDLTTASSQLIGRVHLRQALTATLFRPFSMVIAPGITSLPPITHDGGIESGSRLELVPATGELRLVAIAAGPVSPPPPPPPTPPVVVAPPLPESPPPVRETTGVVAPPTNLRIVGTGRQDRLRGAASNDTILGALGDDTLWGLAGNDTLDGGRGNDTMYGFTGDDVLTCGGGTTDIADGGAGNDVIGCRDGGAGRDIVNCGVGRDRAIVDRRDIVRGCEIVVRR